MNKDLYFEYVEDFADYLVDRVELDEELCVSVVGKFEEIKDIIKELFCATEVDFEYLNLESPILSGYDDEYVLDCWYVDGVMQIGCEPAKRDGKYLRLAGDETYLLENCSSKIIPLCEGSELYFVNLDDECDYDDNCCKCCECDCCCRDTEIADLEKVSYQINGKPVSEEEFVKKYKETHNGFMDDFKTFFARLW